MKTINWKPIDTGKPEINTADAYDIEQQSSAQVLTWVIFKNGDERCMFGRYYHSYETWVLDSVTGSRFTVTHYAEINKP